MPSELIIDDLFTNGRLFLPGRACDAADVRAHFNSNILIDGLSREESQLVLSTLPRDSHRIYLSSLDKGLSGSKVFAGRYEVDGQPVSKLFVFKLGELSKIDNEHAAIERFVRPHIHGIVNPIYRRGKDIGLIVQELAGLGAKSSLRSLKEHARSSSDAASAIKRLLEARLGSWYLSPGKTHSSHELGRLFEWYLSKVTAPDPFPTGWAELKDWVRADTGLSNADVPTIIDEVKRRRISSATTIVHGDLHTQNVLIDEREECWPIDFAWCRDASSPVLDFTMLECSLKFLAFHQRSDLRSLIRVDHALARDVFPTIGVGSVPYNTEISNVLRAIVAVRRFAMDEMNIDFVDYRRALCLMTYVHSTHPLLNRPFVLASLQIHCAVQEEVL